MWYVVIKCRRDALRAEECSLFHCAQVFLRTFPALQLIDGRGFLGASRLARGATLSGTEGTFSPLVFGKRSSLGQSGNALILDIINNNLAPSPESRSFHVPPKMLLDPRSGMHGCHTATFKAFQILTSRVVADPVNVCTRCLSIPRFTSQDHRRAPQILRGHPRHAPI